MTSCYRNDSEDKRKRSLVLGHCSQFFPHTLYFSPGPRSCRYAATGVGEFESAAGSILGHVAFFLRALMSIFFFKVRPRYSLGSLCWRWLLGNCTVHFVLLWLVKVEGGGRGWGVGGGDSF